MKCSNYYYFQLWTPASPGRVAELGSNPGTRGSALAVSWCLKRSRAGPWIAGSSLSYSLSLSRLPPPQGTHSCLANDAVVSTVLTGTQVNMGLLIHVCQGHSEANMAHRVPDLPRQKLRELGHAENLGQVGNLGPRTDHPSLGQRDIRLRRKSEHAEVREQRLGRLVLSQSDTAVPGQRPGLLGSSQGSILQRLRGRLQHCNGRIQTQSLILKDSLQLILGCPHLGLSHLHISAISSHSHHHLVESLELLGDSVDDVAKEVKTYPGENKNTNEAGKKTSILPILSRSSHVEAKMETEAEGPLGANGIQCDIIFKLHYNQSNVVLHIKALSKAVMSRAHFNPTSGWAARNARICPYCVLIDSNAPSTQLSSKLSLCFSLSILN